SAYARDRPLPTGSSLNALPSEMPIHALPGHSLLAHRHDPGHYRLFLLVRDGPPESPRTFQAMAVRARPVHGRSIGLSLRYAFRLALRRPHALRLQIAGEERQIRFHELLSFGDPSLIGERNDWDADAAASPIAQRRKHVLRAAQGKHVGQKHPIASL